MVGVKMTVKNMGNIKNGGIRFQKPPHGARSGVQQQT
jgi:hypothetical protein